MSEIQTKKNLGLWILGGFALVALTLGLVGFWTVKNVMRSLGSTNDGSYFDGSGNVAVLEINGVIMDSLDEIKRIEELESRDDVKAVVIRIDSPGGAVAPSQEIHDAVERLAQHKKVICSFGDLAASGGYYIAVGCPKIVTNPGTLTGSIGVIMEFYNLKDLYAWAKVDPETIKAGKFKDIGSQSRPMTPDERALMQQTIDQVHDQFKAAVSKGRHLDRKLVDAYADGRVLTGEQAVSLGFADKIGGEFDAIEMVSQEAGIKGEPEVLRETPAQGSWRDLLQSQEAGGRTNVVDRLVAAVLPGLSLGSQRGRNEQLQAGVPYLLPAQFLGAGLILSGLRR
jgi:protease-4